MGKKNGCSFCDWCKKYIQLGWIRRITTIKHPENFKKEAIIRFVQRSRWNVLDTKL